MVDSQQNILVEFDYNNIIVVDPNKIIDEDGKAQQRLVKHEELVMYANLECKVLPRTKLAIGVDNNDAIRTVSIASINFLKPGGKTFLDNTYTDEITGKDTLKGEGINQPKSESIKNPKKDNDFFIRQTITSGGKSGAVDTGLLGITTISVRTDTAFTPRISVRLVDVKGRALFEGGDNSPYAAFFNLPYPPFYLTLKGFYGKAIRLTLMLEKFTSSYNSSSGNFDIDLSFLTYKYTVLQEVNMGYVLAAPRMYKNRIKIQTTKGNPSQFSPVNDAIFERGYQKVKELYSEYKSKGLIPDDFPEITIPQMQASIENFVTNVLDKFTKENLDPISFCDTYQRDLTNFAKDVYYILNTSWFDTYMDKKNFFILNDKTKVYQFKKEFESLEKQKGVAIPELDKLIENYRGLLENNTTLGVNGSYTIQGKTKKISIPFMVKGVGMFEKIIQYGDINIKETFVNFKGRQPKDNDELDSFAKELKETILKNSNVNKTKGDNNPQTTYYFFEGPQSFIEAIDNMGKELKKAREEIESELTNALSNLLQSKDSGLGFVPTIRNVLAVVFASGEAFLRLLDDVHKKAYDINSNETGLKIRKSVVFDKEVAGASQDNLSSGIDKNVPIYPWPQVIVATNGENGQERYEIKYPGSNNILNRTKGYLYDVWPEVEFVEEFVKAFVEKTLPPAPLTPSGNEVNETNRLTLNAIEFPVGNDLYANKEEVKFFYEIYERILYTSFYSRLSRVDDLASDSDKISNLIAECENINITKSLSNDNPFLIQKLKQYGINSSNFTAILRQFSNQGLGESWQNFIRGIFNTKYIQNEIENSQIEVIDKNIFTNTKSQPTVSLPNESEFVEYIDNSNTNNKFDLLDIYPFTNTSWDKNYLANGTTILRAENSFNTTKTLTFNTSNKVICSFTDINATDKIRPITNFIYNQVNQPFINKLTDFEELYKERSKFNLQLPTEGNVRYQNYDGFVTDEQTTSIFNTPYFINSIQKGVKNFRENKEYPFVEAAYLFINSLPLATLKEKFKDDNGTTPPSATDLDYIYATLKKFGAIHKLPYAWIIKMGSIWHRYKKYVNDNEDILDSVWSGFSYTLNFDPVTTANTRNYGLTINNVQIDIVLQKDTTIGTELSTLINTGFYPKLINDFNLFYQGFNIFTGYTDTDIQSGITKFGVQINYAADAIIDLPEGTDPNNDMRDIRVIPWTVSVNTLDNKFTYIFPSNGSVTNQAFDECIDLGQLEVEFNNNQSLYDGSVRLFWAAPNYGYFINEKVTKPSPEYCLKQIFSGQSEQENFSINGNESKYTDISEMFSVLDKSVLDSFEQVFLNFSKSVYDYNTPTSSNNNTGVLNLTPSQTGTNTEMSFFNFQKLMRELMKVPSTTGNTGQEIIEKIQGEQLKSIQSYISQFLKYDVVFKFGNTGNFNRKLFYTFSNLPLTDPYTWDTYTSKTPNALPTKGGSVTLQSSQTQFPKEWKKLKTLVGFSTVPELIYSDNGSYITDFFVDLNIAFNVDNIRLFSDIIKVYATQKLNQFQQEPIPAPLPPVTVGPRRVAEAKLKNGNTITVNRLGPKNSGVLRNTQNTILFENSPVFGGPTDADYKSVVDNVIVAVYNSGTTNSGDPQYIVSFVSFADPVYTQTPSPQNKGGLQKFYQSVSNYLLGVDNFMGKIINNLMAKLQVSLPNVNNTPEPAEDKEQNITQTKDDLYESFKSLNDKWISGNDFSTKTFFEDVLIMDRASRNIGDKILVDIYKLKDRLTNINPKTGMLTFVQSILIENHFVVMNIPAYVNFYNVQDAVKDPKPKPEGTLEMANTLFGTFLNVDYRNSSSKLVCFYGGKPSEILDIKNNVDYRYRNDVFDLRRATDNPLVENQTAKKDWDKSNKVVGFNVDMGPQNQGVFQSFSVSQGSGVATAESLQILNQMANQAGNRGGATQSLSLYNVYKNRSYNCTVQMMGCALIQPTMYFNLRYVPMFNGPYMILSVTHTISPGSFETTFTGIRQPVAALPKVDNYIQALRTNLLKSILDKNKEKTAEENKKAKENVISQKDSAVTNANGGKTPSTVQACEAKGEYSTFTKVDNPSFSTLTYKETYDIIIQKMSEFNLSDDGKLKYAVFATLYLESDNSGTNLKAWENNYAGIDLTDTWGPLSSYFTKKEYFCLQTSNGTENLPYAAFENSQTNIEFITKRFKDRMGNVSDGSVKSIAKFWILNRKQKQLPENVYTSMDSVQISDIESRVQKAISTFDGFLQITPTPTPTPTPSPLPPNTPPNPILNVFDPLKNQFRFSILPDTGNWGISRCELTTKCTSDCANDVLNSDITGLIRPELETGTPTVFGGISVYTGTTQNATILLEDLFDEIDCGLDTNPKAELIGKYSFELKVTAIPLKADLQTYDSTRQNVYSTAFYSDEIK